MPCKIGEYVTPLLSKARAVSNEVFLKATAAAFRESWRLVDVLIEMDPVSKSDEEGGQDEKAQQYITQTQAEDVVYAPNQLFLHLPAVC